MAVEVNVRKRKHRTAADEQDDGDVTVPKKMAKKAKSPKKQKKHKDTATTATQQGAAEHIEDVAEAAAANGDAVVADPAEEHDLAAATDDQQQVVEEPEEEEEELNQDSGYEEKAMKFSSDFKMMNFRAKLRGDNFITELRHFLYLTQQRPKIVAKYIEKRGKPLEFVEALERVDKSNVLHVGYICQALQLVLMEILTNQKSHMESAVHASRFFLKSHAQVVDSLLQSAQLKHRRTALKLLTAFVCVEPQLGRQLLSSYDILSNVKTIDNMLSHSRYELNEEESVRKCFIHFVLAYLVDGNTLLIRNILDRGALIRGLVAGLRYDDHVTVCVVLSTLRKYVLECAEISKTKKVHVFDLHCCKDLVRLYDWHGPKVLSMRYNNKEYANKTNLPFNIVKTLVVPEELEAVSAAVHEFLLVLFTSRKHGITFDAMTNFRQRHNAVQGKIIGALHLPWLDERKTELIVRILIACPDLARHTVRHFAGIVNPMRTGPSYWVQSANFLAVIIGTLHPRLLQSALPKITITDYTYWIKDICLPIETLVLLTGSKMLQNAQYEKRLAANRLLLTMFTQYSNYMSAIVKREQAKGVNSLRRFKFDMLNHILLNFPSVEIILISLYMTIKMDDMKPEDVLAHLDVTLDLLLVICKENLSFVSKTGAILDYLELLRPLYANEEANGTGTSMGNIKLEMKAIKTILLLFPRALQPTEQLFEGVLKSFLKAFVRGVPEVQREAGVLLRRIFEQTGLFDAGLMEIDLWLEALRFVDSDTVDVVVQVFLQVLQVTEAEVDEPQAVETVASDKNLQKLFENIEKGLSVQAYVQTLSISKLMPLIYKGIQIVRPLNRYLEVVCLLMYHYYPTPEYVVALYEMQFKGQKQYMRSWLAASADEPLQLEGKYAACVPFLQQVQASILETGQKFEELFGTTSTVGDTIELEFNGRMLRCHGVLQNERILLIYVQQVFFVVAQLVERELLQRVQAERAAAFVNDCVNVVRTMAAKAAAVTDTDAGESSDECEKFLDQMLSYIFSMRISYIRGAELFGAATEPHMNYFHFLRAITENCNSIEHFDKFATNYRLKVVKAVAISLQHIDDTKAQSEQLAESVRLLQALNLDAANCVEILNLLAKHLKWSDFFVAPAATLQQKSVYYDVLVCVLQRLGQLRQATECDDFVKRFTKVYTQLVKKAGAELHLEQLEEAFGAFLQVNHQYIPQLEVKFFDAMFVERKLTKSTIKLACMLFERDDKLQPEFVRHLPAHLNKKELIYPLLDIAFHKQVPLDGALLQTIYQSYKNGFMKTIEKPQKAGVIYKEHVASSIALIVACMPKSECVDFCNKNFKFDVIETYQLRTIQAIYKKAYDSVDLATGAKQKSTIFVNFINLQVQMLAVDLKKQIVDLEKLELFGHFLYDWWQLKAFDVDYSKILKSQQWLNFCKGCLKIGMHVSEAAVEEQHGTADQLNGLLLKLLAFLLDNLYTDYTSEGEECVEPPEGAQLFEMIFTHSKFYDIVLSQRTTKVKTQILHLLYTLAKKVPSALLDTQIPIVLGAYQATLADADRYALALLQLYEVYDCGLQQYRPFIWGESAVAFYALRAADEERAKLTQQETSIGQVMSLIDRQQCEYTINNFPIWRKLHPCQQLPALEFANPALQATTFGTNRLERRIESGANDGGFSDSDLRLCPKRDGLYEQCYDPAFFVPLMNMCFAPEAYAHPARPVQNGLLALVFTALSAQDKDMRLAAGCVQTRYRQHFEQSKFYERPLWIQTYENIQAGLSELRDSWLRHKKNSGTPRVPLIPGLFIAKTLNLTTDPTHLLYKQLTMYLRLKSSFNFQCIPEFNVLFYSPEVEHHEFRQFIVEVIRDGIKSSSDLFLLVTTNTFKVLMGYYGSAMATLPMNLLILSVFSTCVKIPASAKILVEHVGILSWLTALVDAVEFYEFDVLAGLITILNNLWYALQATAGDFHNFAHLMRELHRLLVQLMPRLSARLSPATFTKFLNILQKTAATAECQYRAVNAAQLDHLIGCVEKHFPQQMHAILNIKRYGGAGAASRDSYCRQLYAEQLDSSAILGLASLRAYVIAWRAVNGDVAPAVAALQDSEQDKLPVVTAEAAPLGDLNLVVPFE